MNAKKTDLALLLPGQASQYVGMGQDLYENSRVAKDTLDEIDTYLNRSLTGVMFNGSEEDIIATKNAQPAVAAFSIAIWRMLQSAHGEAIQPAMTAGHSLGEYSLLNIAGVLSLEDTFRLINKRSELMQIACEQHSGSMVAIIGLSLKELEGVCREADVYVSNINSAQQIIISGTKRNLANAIDFARALGAKRAIMLPVNGAFHSKLMATAQNELNQFIGTLSFTPPSIPIIGNVSAEPLVSADEIKDELKAQLQSCVFWSDSMEYMHKEGIRSYLELGPGEVLSGLARRIIKGCDVTSINSFEALMKYADRLN